MHATSRTDPAIPGIAAFSPQDIHPHTDWRATLQGVDVLVHLAARVHQLGDSAENPLQAYRTINTDGTLNMAEQAAQAGIKRFVFLSTAKIWGEQSGDRPFDETTPARPEDPYGISKWEAELGLQRIAQKTGMQYVALRPPLVYGPGVKANFLRLMKWVDRGYPLPFGAINNKRSLIGLGNLVDAIAICAVHPKAANQTFGIADGDALSTSELIRQIALQLDRPARLIPVPAQVLRLVATCIGKEAEINRLTGNFELDPVHLARQLIWRPPYSLKSGLAQTVAWYRSGRGT